MLTVHRIAVGAAAGTAVLALAATGCGSSNSSKTEKPSTTTTAPATPNPAAPALSATEVDKVGTVVTDSDGYVLYRFDKDTAKPSHSNCLAACAAIWPRPPPPTH